MTVRVPSENILDKILKVFGKKRKAIVPEGIDEISTEKGPYVQIKAERESFFKALLGKKN